jgi:hypothetical protein
MADWRSGMRRCYAGKPQLFPNWVRRNPTRNSPTVVRTSDLSFSLSIWAAGERSFAKRNVKEERSKIKSKWRERIQRAISQISIFHGLNDLLSKQA